MISVDLEPGLWISLRIGPLFKKKKKKHEKGRIRNQKAESIQLRVRKPQKIVFGPQQSHTRQNCCELHVYELIQKGYLTPFATINRADIHVKFVK